MSSSSTSEKDVMARFSSIQHKFETVRHATGVAEKKIASKKAELEATHEQIHELEAECRWMESKLVVEKDTMTELRDIVEKQELLQDSLTKATMERNETERQLELVNRLADEQQREFLQQCRDFRSACQRIRLLEKSHPPLVENCDCNVEIKVATKKANECKEKRQVVEALLYGELAEKRQAAADRAKEQANQVSLQQGRLERIQKDTQEMQEEVSNLLRQIRRSQEMRDNFCKVATQRKKQQERTNRTAGQSTSEASRRSAVTPSPRNPYAKKQAPETSNAPKSKMKKNNPSTLKSGQKRRNDALLERQHPHRAGGRIRVDRQFSTALEIVSGNNDEHNKDSEEESLELESTTWCSTEEEEQSMEENTTPTTNTITTATAATSDGSSSLLERLKALQDEDDDDDDDDDDDLFSYVPFFK